MEKYILSLDQGTTSSRAIIFNRYGENIATAQKEYGQFFPKNGWVEQDPLDILNSQLECANKCIKAAGVSVKEIAAVGIANQRETVVMWDKISGKPVYNAIVWQCRRTAKYCKKLEQEGYSDFFREKTGLIIDAYFCATKIKWIFDNVEGVRQMAENGRLLFGTVDSWLIWNLTGGKVHATDYSNASRTMLFNIHSLKWDEDILNFFGIPKNILPQVRDNSGDFGRVKKDIFGEEIPICGCAGDQQSALFGQKCFNSGDVKNTYGTGGFLLINTADKPINSRHGLLTTIGWSFKGKLTYALEGSVFVCGDVIKWLRDKLGIIDTAKQTQAMAQSVKDCGGVYFVPAFVGLGAPYWDSCARGTIVGLTAAVGKEHIVRAALEAIAYQTYQVIQAMGEDVCLNSIKVDGGASQNDFLMQFQADILGCEIIRPKNVESTALGAAYLAGLGVGMWADLDELPKSREEAKVFTPSMEQAKREQLISDWKRAVERSLKWL